MSSKKVNKVKDKSKGCMLGCLLSHFSKKKCTINMAQRSDAAQINREGETFDKRTDGASVTFAFSFE